MRKLLSGTLAFLIFALGPSGAVLAGDSDIRSVIESLNATWNEAFNRGDASAVAALYRENATLSPGNGKVLRGRAEIENLFQSFIDNGVAKHRIEIVDVRAEGDFAYEVARWSANGPEKDGKATNLRGVLMHVFKRGEDGEWKSVTQVWNAFTE